MTKIIPTESERRLLAGATNKELMRIFRMKDDVYNRRKQQLDLSNSPHHRFNLPWVDPLSYSWRDFKFTESKMRSFVYTGASPLTTMCFEIYGTVSAWWIVLGVNGYCHVDDIPTGAELKFPDAGELAENIRKKDPAIGKIVRI